MLRIIITIDQPQGEGTEIETSVMGEKSDTFTDSEMKLASILMDTFESKLAQVMSVEEDKKAKNN